MAYEQHRDVFTLLIFYDEPLIWVFDSLDRAQYFATDFCIESGLSIDRDWEADRHTGDTFWGLEVGGGEAMCQIQRQTVNPPLESTVRDVAEEGDRAAASQRDE